MKVLQIFMVISALAMLVNATAVNGAPPSFGLTTATGYLFAGYSSGTTTGSAGGVGGMNAFCKVDFDQQARMCTTREWWDSITENNSHPDDGDFAWAHIDPAAMFVSGSVADAYDYFDSTGYSIFISVLRAPSEVLSCKLWRSSQPIHTGVGVAHNSVGSAISDRRCDTESPVACCVPPKLPAK